MSINIPTIRRMPTSHEASQSKPDTLLRRVVLFVGGVLIVVWICVARFVL